LKELLYRPEEILFVDDSELNLKVSQKYGLIPIKICRSGRKSKKCRFVQIGSLKELALMLLEPSSER
jgi:FMN phosphatase YigB (HAD superfamily)